MNSARWSCSTGAWPSSSTATASRRRPVRFDPMATAPYSGPADAVAPDLTAAGQVMGTPVLHGARAGRGAEPTRSTAGPTSTAWARSSTRSSPASRRSAASRSRRSSEGPRGTAHRPRSSAIGALPLEAVCLKAMAKDPDGRYATAAELAADVQHWLADEPVSAWREPWRSCPTVGGPAPDPGRRRRRRDGRGGRRPGGRAR